jgi:hypothetical protein
VAAQTEITGRCTSLTKQRRAVLPNPAALESVDEVHTHPYVELIPRAKNRSTVKALFRHPNFLLAHTSPLQIIYFATSNSYANASV